MLKQIVSQFEQMLGLKNDYTLAVSWQSSGKKTSQPEHNSMCSVGY